MTRWFRQRAGPLALCALVAAAIPSFCAAEQATSRVPTVTRLVKIFLDKETALGAAVRAGDGTALGAMLQDDFELRTGPRAANPIPRAEWMHELLRTRDPGGAVSRMAVHDFGAVAIASFVQEGAGGPILVVDVWKASGMDWKLAIRYAGATGPPGFPIPGAGAMEPEIPKKY
jgi:hypothetical protein